MPTVFDNFLAQSLRHRVIQLVELQSGLFVEHLHDRFGHLVLKLQRQILLDKTLQSDLRIREYTVFLFNLHHLLLQCAPVMLVVSDIDLGVLHSLKLLPVVFDFFIRQLYLFV